ncbi:MAG: cytochrome ubiquinol oxidase subunit I [Betaproteobacteria bacterium]|nr:cytochrome ubiquinol oxidase subunit I [Betaproteobacteria bacterium]NBP11499.1 cytochrome ubiquinol oxidase subunit I [Betaproteobacteria bacterium]NBQ10095.1 cytochrome ubiquinol oxidase subunit I [Betaproteobacteria bacterium]NBS22206.1 cytochrome ubiquinol oxidase subunit I [Betaproteobacteria bacterium]NBS40032.1 cytochrome ubiquinol oxidase subunit I [Betaproteobacteria bacterium]
MNELDPLLLARIQFAANVTFHILFPSITIGLGWVLLFFKLRFQSTRQAHWMDAYSFWVKVFALSFALGVVSGVTMSFQFGTNWPGFMNTVGNVAGPLLAYEVLTAFFLEATMLGIMLFGRDRVSERVHTLATVLVAVGTTASAFWILALNSWMHTPAGFVMVEGKAHVTSWLEVIFNPSFPYRITHMMLASGLTASFLVAGLSAYRWRRGDRAASVSAALRTGVFTAALLIPVQIIVGDMHGLNTMKHQPAKLAAMEGIWETQRGVAAVLFAIPDSKAQANRMEIAIPKLASFYLTHDWDGEVKGLKAFDDKIPPVAPVFFAFRIMVGVGLLMLAIAWLAAWNMRSMTLLPQAPDWLYKGLVSMTFSGWIALVSGWYVTEMGRQPWLVSGVLTTAQAASSVPAPHIALSLAMYLSLYLVLLGAYVSVVFYLARKASTPELAQCARENSRPMEAAHA